MDVGRREGVRGVIDTAARYTVAGRVWDRAYCQICAERDIGHLINVIPESEVYRFGNGGLLTFNERVTDPVVLADHPLLLSYSVVASPVLSLLIGRDVVEGLGLDIKGGSKILEYNGLNGWKTRWLDIMAWLRRLNDTQDSWSSKIHLIRPSADCVHVPHHLSRGTANRDSHRRWKFVFPTAATSFVDSSSLIALPQQMRSILISVLCSRLSAMQVGRIIWHVLESQWLLRVNSLRHRLRFRINSDVACEKRLFINCAQIWNVHELWLTIAFIHLVSDLICGWLERHLLTPWHTPSFLVSSLFLLSGRFLWTALLNVWNDQQILVCLSLLGYWTLSWNSCAKGEVFDCGSISVTKSIFVFIDVWKIIASIFTCSVEFLESVINYESILSVRFFPNLMMKMKTHMVKFIRISHQSCLLRTKVPEHRHILQFPFNVFSGHVKQILS